MQVILLIDPSNQSLPPHLIWNGKFSFSHLEHFGEKLSAMDG